MCPSSQPQYPPIRSSHFEAYLLLGGRTMQQRCAIFTKYERRRSRLFTALSGRRLPPDHHTYIAIDAIPYTCIHHTQQDFLYNTQQ